MLTDKEILQLYRSPTSHGAFAGVKSFQDAIWAEKHELIPQTRLYKILKSYPLYIQHMKTVKKFPQRKYQCTSFGQIVEADLAEMPEAEGFKYFLVVVDAYSKHLYAEPMKTKTAAETRKGFEKIFSQFGSAITKLQTDQGQEFVGNKKYFKDKHIYFHTKVGRNKASFAESSIRLIKRRLYMMLRSEMSKNWPKYLPLVIESLNKRHVASLGGVQPEKINSFLDDPLVVKAQAEKNITPYSEPHWKEQNKRQEWALKNPNEPFPIGSYVYLDLPKDNFTKGFDYQRGAIYIVRNINGRIEPNLYQLEDLMHDLVPGWYYAQQLKLSPKPTKSTDWTVEKVLKRRVVKGKKEVLVKFLFYPNKFNMWIPEANIIQNN